MCRRSIGMTKWQVINHYNIRRVVDIYGSVQDRDLGAVGRDVTRIVDAHRKSLPRGSFVTIRGQYGTMRTAYLGLLGGLAFAIVLVYLLIVVNFQSWLDPFIIITALPAALAGIVLFLFITHTTLSVPALMGAIMCMGVATANSILVVAFAKERLLAPWRCRAGRDRSRHHALPPGHHDRPGDDHRHDPHGARPGRWRRTECAAGAGRDRRSSLRHGRHPDLCSSRLQPGAWKARLRGCATRRRRRAAATPCVINQRSFLPTESTMSTSEINQAEVHPPQIPQPEPDPPKHHWLLIGLLIAVFVLGFVIYDGIHTRAASEAALVQTTDQAAIPAVNVVLPVPNSAPQEVVIPGNTRAFDDTPIYARTDGYLKHWYVDIGAHVKAGQVLAQIETPEVDQQLLQARADLVTAEANAKLAKVNSTRYQKLLTQNAVTKQDTDTFVSQAASTSSTVNSMIGQRPPPRTTAVV